MTDTIRSQVMAIRDSGKTNMLDSSTVQYLAYHMGFYELVVYIEEHRKDYIQFILTGKES